ncbi:MAG TPA: site-2 protease family protein [Candidatus Saccharibacteria bacterium]|mgnify:CR=1 FL=1|jgi:Zn-dependent protease|nr:site-2 protease family protein [Candidatus Saccharibacteria bacterium]HMT55980.1 site-2 protease family protein [Candidatus Saccharibacteria bacterium]
MDSNSFFTLVTFLVVLFVSVSFHEMMHALVAYRLGDDLAHSHGRISLNPLRHIDPFLTIGLPAVMLLLGLPPILAAKPVPINTHRISGEELGLAAVGLAGPLSNLFLATIGGIVYGALTNGGLVADIVELFVQVNISLFVFNMLPIPPLDGSRLLFAVAPQPVQEIMERIERAGIMFVMMFLFILLPAISPILDRANNFFLNLLIR